MYNFGLGERSLVQSIFLHAKVIVFDDLKEALNRLVLKPKRTDAAGGGGEGGCAEITVDTTKCFCIATASFLVGLPVGGGAEAGAAQQLGASVAADVGGGAGNAGGGPGSSLSLYRTLDAELGEEGGRGSLRACMALEMAIAPVLHAMEAVGVPINGELFLGARGGGGVGGRMGYPEKIARLKNEQCERAFRIAGEELRRMNVAGGHTLNTTGTDGTPRRVFEIANPKSKGPDSTYHVLFEELKLEYPERAGRRPSVRKEVLLAMDSELARVIVIVRELDHLLGIIKHDIAASSQQSQQDPHGSLSADGERLRLKYKVFTRLSETGRIHFEPPLQCLRRADICDASRVKIADSPRVLIGRKDRDGYVIMSCDYRQYELRLMAHFSQDPVLLSSFEGSKDFFTDLAHKWLQVPYEQVTPEERQNTKRLCYGILYGMGALSLSNQLENSEGSAQLLMDKLKECLGGVTRWMDEVKEDAARSKHVRTLGGRRRAVTTQHKAKLGRVAVNTMCQGSAADIMKRAMVDVDRKIRTHAVLGRRESCRIILQIHDELLFEVRRECVQEAAALVARTMENAWEGLRVPLRVAVRVGTSWGALNETITSSSA